MRVLDGLGLADKIFIAEISAERSSHPKCVLWFPSVVQEQSKIQLGLGISCWASACRVTPHPYLNTRLSRGEGSKSVAPASGDLRPEPSYLGQNIPGFKEQGTVEIRRRNSKGYC